MICVKIMGGLGNQMYQYAIGRYLSMKNDTNLQYDMSYFSYCGARDFMLNHFLTVGEPTTSSLIQTFAKTQTSAVALSGNTELLKTLEMSMYVAAEKNSQFDPAILQLPYKNIYLSGYWGTYKYSFAIRDVLKKDFQCKTPLSMISQEWKRRISMDTNVTVALHVRRGDYIASEINRIIYKVLPISYYQECIDQLKREYGNISVYVFSNDMEWVKENLKFPDVQMNFVEGSDEAHGYEDMALMWECQHHIIANSTFSWWGAYLAKKPGKTYAPSEWFNVQGDAYDIRDNYPADWIQIKV